jgi:hypothetical protein
MLVPRNVTILTLWCASSLYSSDPVGSISSRGAVNISGVRVDIAEVPSWPVVTGDDLGTFAEPAMINFDDGSRLLIDSSSVVRLEQRSKNVMVVVLSGSADFILAGKSELQVYANDTLVTKQGVKSGTASVVGKRSNRAQVAEERIKKWNDGATRKNTQRSVSPYEPR